MSISGGTPPPLFNRGFNAFATAQFFGIANDYVLKSVLTFALASQGLWGDKLGKGGQAFPAYLLVIPFILFCGIAGSLADKYSKQQVAVWVKRLELFTASVALVGFMLGNCWVCLLAMALMGTHSAFFSPTKYGLIPELSDPRNLSRANGVINMLGNLAAILSSLAGGYIYLLYLGELKQGGQPNGMTWLPGVVMVILAVWGIYLVSQIPKMEAQNPHVKIRFGIRAMFVSYYDTMIEMIRSGKSVATVALLWSLFYLIAYNVMLILPDYTEVLKLNEAEVSKILLGPLGISIAVGCLSAGYISGKTIETRLVLVGLIGLTACFFTLGTGQDNKWIVMVLICLAGIFAGLYLVPLQALLQKLTPPEKRGQYLGTAAALSAICEVIGIGIFHLFRGYVKVGAPQMFLIVGAVTLVVTLWVVFFARINRPEWR